eukprot:8822052-Lingulodinium_polyedra.AAC.1
MAQNKVLAAPPMPMPRRRMRLGPKPFSVRAVAARPQTRAQAAPNSHEGIRHLLSTSPSQTCPMRSKAFSWSAR